MAAPMLAYLMAGVVDSIAGHGHNIPLFRARTIRSLWPGFTRENRDLGHHSVKGPSLILIQLFAGEGQIPSRRMP